MNYDLRFMIAGGRAGGAEDFRQLLGFLFQWPNHANHGAIINRKS
jgi:hypothetical protein